MRALFTITLFLSSALLFLVQPMIAKMILPRFGGSPGVWNTSMLFFQAALLLGYGYAHLATKWLGPKLQALTHIGVLLLPLIVLPVALPAGISLEGGASPAPRVLLILAISVGLPFFVVSAGAPLLQRWFAATGDPHGNDPYFLYSASNLGSLIALLAYPFVVEPLLRVSQQTQLWSYAYYALVLLMALCAGLLWRSHGRLEGIHGAPVLIPPEPETKEHDATPTNSQRLRWIALAFCPSSLLLGVTTYLTSNIAPVPMLWVIPLALYLVTFIIAFAKRQPLTQSLLGRLVPLVVIPLSLIMVLEASDASLMIPLSVFHLLTFFAVALMCHGGLARSRPHAERLTEFYFFVSLGGVLGGAFNALVAPLLFNSYFEYPLVLAAACYFLPRGAWKPNRMDLIYPLIVAGTTIAIIWAAKQYMPDPSNARTALAIGVPLILVFFASDRGPRFAASLALVFVITSAMQVAVLGRVIEAKRSFFGVHRVLAYRTSIGEFHNLIHGNTLHGRENLSQPGIPLTYYTHSGPIGQVFEYIGARLKDVAMVGLGVGSIASYGQPGQRFTCYEIDPDVVAVARNPKFFDFVQRCQADFRIVLGDARIELNKAPEGSYDLIALDAFSSDSIPIHLLTREALAMYLSKLKPGGIIAFHISNQYLNLQPILGNLAQAENLVARVFADLRPPSADGTNPSTWVVMARQQADLDGMNRDVRFEELLPDPHAPLWTDDYSNILSVFKSLHPSGN